MMLSAVEDAATLQNNVHGKNTEFHKCLHASDECVEEAQKQIAEVGVQFD